MYIYIYIYIYMYIYMYVYYMYTICVCVCVYLYILCLQHIYLLHAGLPMGYRGDCSHCHLSHRAALLLQHCSCSWYSRGLRDPSLMFALQYTIYFLNLPHKLRCRSAFFYLFFTLVCSNTHNRIKDLFFVYAIFMVRLASRPPAKVDFYCETPPKFR